MKCRRRCPADDGLVRERAAGAADQPERNMAADLTTEETYRKGGRRQRDYGMRIGACAQQPFRSRWRQNDRENLKNLKISSYQSISHWTRMASPLPSCFLIYTIQITVELLIRPVIAARALEPQGVVNENCHHAKHLHAPCREASTHFALYAPSAAETADGAVKVLSPKNARKKEDEARDPALRRRTPVCHAPLSSRRLRPEPGRNPCPWPRHRDRRIRSPPSRRCRQGGIRPS